MKSRSNPSRRASTVPPVTATATAVVLGIIGLNGCTRASAAAPAGDMPSPSYVVTVAPTAPPVVPPTAPPVVPPTAPPVVPPPAPPSSSVLPAPNAQVRGAGNEVVASVPRAPTMSFDAIWRSIDSTGDSESAEVLARGDVDGDGDEDALAQVTWCGASCAPGLYLTINDSSTGEAIPVPVGNGFDSVFEPWFIFGSAVQTQVSSAAILQNNVVVSGFSLCGDAMLRMRQGEGEPTWPCDEDSILDVERTAVYEYSDGVVRPVSIDPPLA